MVSENKRKSLDAYNATCDYISLRPKKERGLEIRSAAKAAGQSMTQYALAWALRQPAVRCVLLGVKREAQLDEAAAIF